MYVKNQIFLVLGVSKSGTSATKNILSRGGKCYIYEQLKSEKVQNSIEELLSLGAEFVRDEQVEQVLNRVDVVIISPGIAINHKVAVRAKQLNKRIIGELEFGYQLFIPPMVAVTGTNGKTTTVSFIDAIFNQAKLNCSLCGNVGVPITSKLNDGLDRVLVVEVSSFQLESISEFKPHISCFLNFSADHLERHYSMDNYLYLKKRIFKNQTESEFAVLNYDDTTIRELANEIRAKCLFISLNEIVDGAYMQGQSIYFNGEKIMDVCDLTLTGEHNIYNALFAICVSKLMGIDTECIRKALMNFKGVRHRIELIAKINGISFYNDSKATNTASTISAIKSMKNETMLILGGSEKGEDYTLLFNEISSSNVVHTVITGASGLNMVKACEQVGYKNYTYTLDFANAVHVAKMFAKNGQNVLLSPACASFDKFKNYEERGDAFVQLVIGENEKEIIK